MDELNFDELPSVFCRPFADGTQCYYLVINEEKDIYFTKELGELRSFLQGYFVARGYIFSSLTYANILIGRMEYKK